MPGPAGLELPVGNAPAAHLHKLTVPEFNNSLHDLLGTAAPVAAVEPDLMVNGFATIGASSVAPSPGGVELYESTIRAATTFAFADATHVASALACVPTATTDMSCLTRAIAAFGRRAFRRPLTSEETTRFVGYVTTIGNQPGSSLFIGLRHAIDAILQSPYFLYRVELGAPSAQDGGRSKYDGFEVASRMASTFWTSVPDDALLDAAQQGALDTPDGIRTQAQRMLADPRVHRSVSFFVDQLFDAQRLSQSEKDPMMFPTWTDTLRDAMLQELELRFDNAIFTDKSDFLNLFDGRTTFVNNELARFYGVAESPMDMFHRVDMPADSPRVGLLGAGAVLAGHALPQRTSPTARGKFVNEMLLCRTVAPPPMAFPFPDATDTNVTVRQRLTAHRANPFCASCHGVTDPIGLGMENFDTTGKFRTMDNGAPIDASGTLDNMPFNDLADLGGVLRKEAVLGPCFISKMYASSLGRIAINLDAPALEQLAMHFTAAGNRIGDMLVDLVASDSFRFVEPSK